MFILSCPSQKRCSSHVFKHLEKALHISALMTVQILRYQGPHTGYLGHGETGQPAPSLSAGLGDVQVRPDPTLREDLYPDDLSPVPPPPLVGRTDVPLTKQDR